MFRFLFLFLLFLDFVPAQAQRQVSPDRFKQAFSPEYAWQSKYLFDYDVHFYGLDISVSPVSRFIQGSCTLEATTLIPHFDTLAVELIPEMEIDSALFKGRKLAVPQRDDNNVLFVLPDIPDSGSLFSVQIFYHGTPPEGGFFSGVTTAYNATWDKRVTWSLSEPFAAKQWFPVKEDLKDKADSAWIFLTVDSIYMAGSEGLLTRVVDLPGGKRRFEWKTHYPIDYYLLSFAVADYRDFSFYAHPDDPKGDSVLVQNFIYDSDAYLKQNEDAIKRTAKFIELYVKLFGPYPFRKEKYGHCLTELPGGMEHQTMTTLGSFGFDLVAHELGHMWFGDDVTCADWSDIWVNEGFASYADYLANEYILGDSIAQIFIRKAEDYVMTQPGGSVYIPEDQIYMGNEGRIFNGRLSYDKGAVLLHMLRHEIHQDSVFFTILKTYLIRFAGGVATGDDFRKIVDEITGKDYRWFFQQWYYGEGYPEFSVDWYQQSDSLHILSTETTSTDNPSFFKMTVDYQLVYDNGLDTIVRLVQTEQSNHFVVPVKGKVSAIHIDPDHWSLLKVLRNDFVGIQEEKNPASFTLSPVPVRNMLFMQFFHPDRSEKNVIISDMNGRIFFRKNTTAVRFQIPVSKFPPGLYVARVMANGQIYVKKFVKW